MKIATFVYVKMKRHFRPQLLLPECTLGNAAVVEFEELSVPYLLPHPSLVKSVVSGGMSSFTESLLT